ncbi:MAG: hypothetical protein AAFR59_03225 [Bacteroidota bacterium]
MAIYDSKQGNADPNVPLNEQVTPADMNAIKSAIEALQQSQTDIQTLLGQISGSYMSKDNYDPSNTGNKVAAASIADFLTGFDAAQVGWYHTKNAQGQAVWQALPVGGGSSSGTQLYVGATVPDPAIGSDGDIYIQADTPLKAGEPLWYAKVGTDWTGGIFFGGNDGAAGADGASAYQVWLDQGNVGTEQDFLDSLQGVPGPQGDPGGNYSVTEGINLAAFITFNANGVQHGDIYSPLTDTKYFISVPNPTDLGSAIVWIQTATKPEFVSDQNVLLVSMGNFLDEWEADKLMKMVLTLKKVDNEYHILASLDPKGKILSSVGSGANARMYEDLDDWSLNGAQVFGRGSSVRSTTVPNSGSYHITAQENTSVPLTAKASYVWGVPFIPNDRKTCGLAHASDAAANDGQYNFQYLGGWFIRHKNEAGNGDGPFAFDHGVDEWFIDILDAGAACTIEIGKWVGGVKANNRQVLRTINEVDRLDNLFWKETQRQSVTNESTHVRRYIE